MSIVANADFPTNHSAAASRCAFVLHGLNTNPKRMEDLAELTRQAGFTASVGQLTGHGTEINSEKEKKITAEIWKQDFIEQWSAATAKCTGNKDERLFVAYSLGAVTGLNVFDSSSGISLPTKMILISPAITLRKKTLLVRAISWIPFGSIPSVNHPDYRAREYTPLRNYKALFQLRDQWLDVAWSRTGTVKTFVVLSPEDELVDSQDANELVTKRNLKTWTIHWLNNASSELSPKYYHLIIDVRSQGQEQWDLFSARAKEFIQQD